MEPTGWEIPDLTTALQLEFRRGKTALTDYCRKNPLASLNQEKDHFVVVRKFAGRENDGKIDLLNAQAQEGQPHFPIACNGMTLVKISDFGASSNTVVLPNELEFHSVTLDRDEIHLSHSQGKTVTNFEEIQLLWTIHQFTESEIRERFFNLNNHRKKPVTKNLIKKSTINDPFFGELVYSQKLDWFEKCLEIDGKEITFSFDNTSPEQMKINLRSAENLIPQLSTHKKRMVKGMLELYNEDWREDEAPILDKRAFSDQITLYSICIFEEGGADIFCEANDLFAGHEILISLNEEYEYLEASIVG